MSKAVAKKRPDLGADIPRGRTQAYNMKRARVESFYTERRSRETDEMTTLNWFAHTKGKELSGEPLTYRDSARKILTSATCQ